MCPPAGVPPGGDISTFPLIYPLFPARVSSAAPPSRSAHPCPAPAFAPRCQTRLWGCSGAGHGRAAGTGIHPLSCGFPGPVPTAGNADRLWLYRASPGPTLGHLTGPFPPHLHLPSAKSPSFPKNSLWELLLPPEFHVLLFPSPPSSAGPSSPSDEQSHKSKLHSQALMQHNCLTGTIPDNSIVVSVCFNLEP